jgi:hypothetical protein
MLVSFAAAVVIALVGTSLLFADELDTSDLPGLVSAALAVVVALITLWHVAPTPAKVIVVRQDELEFDDLIFYLVDLPLGRVPRDFLLQLHVAVANVGGRKAVVSRITIDQFSDRSGTPVDLPGATKTHGATRYRQRSGWRDGHPYFENEMEPGPWLLAPDDVMALRFRCRRGVDWSPRLELPELRAIHDALQTPIERARGTVIWRERQVTREDRFEVAVEAVQQNEYAAALRRLTQDFTVMPSIPHQPFDIE